MHIGMQRAVGVAKLHAGKWQHKRCAGLMQWHVQSTMAVQVHASRASSMQGSLSCIQ
jgi:hypothetical protein